MSATTETLGAPIPVDRPAGRARRARWHPRAVLGMVLTTVFVVAGVLGPALAPHDPFAITGSSLDGPSAEHLMGTDTLGRDLFSGVLHGARTSLIIVVAVVALTLVTGVLVGALSGWFGGWIDDALMRVTEFFQVMPRFFLALIVIALFGPGLDHLVLVIGLTSWAILARVVRAEILSLREREFVDAARASGASGLRILTIEVLPNALPPTAAYIGLIAAQALLLEASVGFLGLSDPETMSWGFLAGQAQRFLRVAWWLSFFPGLAITLAVLGLNLAADAATEQVEGYG